MSQPIPDLTITSGGITVHHDQLSQILSQLPSHGFSKAEFEKLLCDKLGIDASTSGDVTRRVMQHLKRKGVIRYAAKSKTWHVITAPVVSMSSANQTPIGPIPVTEPLVTPPLVTAAPEPFGPQHQSFGDVLRNLFLLFLARLACLSAVLALVSINASFAWGLAETDLFRAALVAGLIASDVMRPLLIARGLYEGARGRWWRGLFAVLIAITLAPVSVLSSTSVISATLFLGVEENDKADQRGETMAALKVEHDRLQVRIGQQWQNWEVECARGGCGPVAEGLEVSALATESQATEVLHTITELTQSGDETSAFIARTVKSFEALYLFGPGREMLIPLLLALTLEVAALFGPALLLSRRSGRVKVRA